MTFSLDLSDLPLSTDPAHPDAWGGKLETHLQAIATGINTLAAEITDVERGANVKKWGATGAGIIDDGPAIQAAITALAPLVGTVWEKTLFIPEGTYLSNQELTSNAPLHIWGVNRLGTVIRIGSSFPSGGTLLSFVLDGSSPVTLEGKVPGVGLHGFTLDGAHRSIPATALHLDFFDRAQIDIYVTCFKGTVLKARCLRESNIRIRSWLCGWGPTYPVLDLDETGTTITEGSNLNMFDGCCFALNMGDHMRVRSPATASNRQHYFNQCIFHGLNEWIEYYADEFGYFDLGQDGNVPARFVIDNGRSIFFNNCRMHLNGRGQPLFWLTNTTAGASTFNSVTVGGSGMSYRGNTGSVRSLFSVDTTADSMQVTGVYNPVGGAGSNRHLLQTGSRVQFTAPSSGSLPGGITAGSDYYAISVDGTNFKVATSRANALAGTAVDITATGTGTVTQFDWAATVDTTADTLTIPDHKFTTGARVRVGADVTQPTGLTAATDYFAVRVDKDTLKFATTAQNAVTATTVDITAAGSRVWMVPQDFVAHVESGTLNWTPGNTVDNTYAPVRGYLRVEDSGSTPVGALKYGAGTIWSTSTTVPVAEFASGTVATWAIDAGILLTRNNHPIYMTLTDGTPVSIAKITASNAVNVGSLSGTTANAIFSATGLATINGGGSERFRASSVGLSFHGAAAVAKGTITGSRGSNAALASLLTYLASIGLLTDSSS